MKLQKQKTVRLFTLAQLSIVFVFSAVLAFALLRLAQVNDILTELSNDAVPQITQASSLNSQIQNLATLTNLLSSSTNNPARQLAKQKIDNVLSLINQSLFNNDLDSQFLNKQISVVSKEIDELDELVEQRITQGNIVASSQDEFYTTMFDLLSQVRDSGKAEDVQNVLFDVLVLSVAIRKQNKMHEIRQIESQIEAVLEVAYTNLSNDNGKFKRNLTALNEQLIGPNGLINKKIESLRVEGRTRGRDNFVRNLIADVASSLQYKTQIVNLASSTAAKKASTQTSLSTQVIIIIGLFSTLLALSIIYFLYKRIVSRLLSLSRQVANAIENDSTEITISGNDEISGLADAFSNYLHKVKEQESALLNMTLTDPLTGIANRRSFENQLEKAISLARRNQWCLSIMMIDVDYFKPYNDYYGHSDGDVCLRLIASQLNEIVSRNTDFCARFGGEEFVCILPDTTVSGAKMKAEELRESVESLQIPHASSGVSRFVTISVGVATFPFSQESNWMKELIIEQADRALYKAKADGRNRCHYFAVNQTLNDTLE